MPIAGCARLGASIPTMRALICGIHLRHLHATAKPPAWHHAVTQQPPLPSLTAQPHQLLQPLRPLAQQA
eukprot:4715405-Alexandrium_andersonii.AAC.1